MAGSLRNSLILLTVLALMPLSLLADPDSGHAARVVDTPASSVVDDLDDGWTWHGMVSIRDPKFSGGTAHVGGPDTYGVYVFQGAGVEVYGYGAASYSVGDALHSAGKVQVSVDGKVISTTTIDASAGYDYKMASITGLSKGNHVLQVNPIDGWAAIDSIKLLTSPAASADPHLVAEFLCDEGRGPVVTDASGHGLIGTLMGAATWTTAANGKHALSFPAPGGVEIPQAIVDTGNSFTVAAWVKPSNTSANQSFVGIDGINNSGFYLECTIYSGVKFRFTMVDQDGALDPGQEVHSTASTFTPQVGTWYLLVGVYNAAARRMALYVNGALQDNEASGVGWHAYGPTAIGRSKFGAKYANFATADIADVRFYDTALSASAVASLD